MKRPTIVIIFLFSIALLEAWAGPIAFGSYSENPKTVKIACSRGSDELRKTVSWLGKRKNDIKVLYLFCCDRSKLIDFISLFKNLKDLGIFDSDLDDPMHKTIQTTFKIDHIWFSRDDSCDLLDTTSEVRKRSIGIIERLSEFGYIQIFYFIILIVVFLSSTCYGLIMYDSWNQRNKLAKQTNALCQPNSISEKAVPDYYVRQLNYDFVWKSPAKVQANES